MPGRKQGNPDPDATETALGKLVRDSDEWLSTDARPEEAWRPKPGERIIGRITDIDVRPVAWRDVVRDVVVLALDTGDPEHVATVWCMQTVLANEVRKLAPQIGDVIGILRLDDADDGYRRYRVGSPTKNERTFDWLATKAVRRTVTGKSPEDWGHGDTNEGLPF